MKTSEYLKIYKEINNADDLKKFEDKYDRGMLESILSHKIVRNTKRNYYKIQNKMKRIVTEWKNGKSFLQISKDNNFPPIMIASMILENIGIKRSEIRKWIKDVDSIEDDRIRRELKEAENNDVIYSQKGIQERAAEGDFAEEKIAEWLNKNSIEFVDEEELRKEGGKTPDFLLKEKIEVNGKKIQWIESKASFGDRDKLKRDIKKQASHYVEEHGTGMLVYWYGFLEDDKNVENERIIFVDRTFFED